MKHDYMTASHICKLHVCIKSLVKVVLNYPALLSEKLDLLAIIPHSFPAPACQSVALAADTLHFLVNARYLSLTNLTVQPYTRHISLL